MMPATGILDIIIIIYYFPALLIAIYLGLKHGFNKSLGWFNLNLLSLFRLVGSALGLATIYQPNEGVFAASLVLSNMGTISLLGTLLGLVGRVNQSLKERALPPRIAKYVQLLTIVAVVLAIVGGDKAFSNDASTRSNGHDLSKAAIILLIIIYVVAVGICSHTLLHFRTVPQGERRLLYVATTALPFVLVRLILAICSVFLYTSNVFGMTSTSNVAIVVKAIMGVLMEFIVVALFLWAGCTVNRSEQREAERAQRHAANGNYQGQHGVVQDFNIETPKQYTDRV